MPSFYDTFETDTNLECGEGVDLDYRACGVITIHRAGGANRKFQRVLAAKSKPYARQIQLDELDDETDMRIIAETYAETVIIGWRGVKDRQGLELPFTKENVVKLLMELPELFADIRRQARDISNFRKAAVEADAKNLSRPSGSTSGSEGKQKG